ncbi:GPI mannosyltransferase 4 [Chelonia mydas]|uniref:GPI mannosyltransferase 4 n=1 Tax=Chelonia mydas TaxID=8469 RepID=M7BB54_CHEMY|nr:GPI mannosyltransferase 4 [Chelonia mydas]
MQSSSAEVTMMESQNRKRAPAWTEREVRDLIAVWREESVLSERRSSFRNAKTFVKISKGMKDRGHNRDPKQCRVKLKELRQAYQKTREANGRSGSEPQTCRFNDELRAILGVQPPLPQRCCLTPSMEMEAKRKQTGYLHPDEFFQSPEVMADYSVYQLAPFWGADRWNALVLLAGSYVTLVFYTRTFTNTLEGLLFALLMVLVSPKAVGYGTAPKSDISQSIVYVPTKRIKSTKCVLNTVASIDLWSGALWVAIPQFPQSPLPIGILG